MAKKVTLHDIAIAANVADSTASKALTGTGRISAETRRRVRDIAAQFGYARPATKTRTGNGRTGLIGIVTPDRNGRFALPLLAGAERALGAHNHAALLMISQGVPALERSHINQLSAQGVDGLIIAGNTCNARHPIDPRIQNVCLPSTPTTLRMTQPIAVSSATTRVPEGRRQNTCSASGDGASRS